MTNQTGMFDNLRENGQNEKKSSFENMKENSNCCQKFYILDNDFFLF
jgi:hypothetical protein